MALNDRATEQRERRAWSWACTQKWTRWMYGWARPLREPSAAQVGTEQPYFRAACGLGFFERGLSVPAFQFPFSLLLRPVGLTPDCTIVTWGSLENNRRGSDSSGLGGIWAWIKLKNLPLVIQMHSRTREPGTQARLVRWSVSRLSVSRLLPYHLPSLNLL